METKLIKGLEKIEENDIVVICLPHAGGGASFFNSWSRYFKKPYAICPVQLPGREERIIEKPVESMTDIAGEIVEILMTLKNDFILFGHSMGTKMLFEVEKLLEKNGRMAKLAVVSACPPPDRLESEKIAHLPDDRFIEALLNYDGIPQVLLENRQLLDMFLPMLKADFRLSEDYVCEDSTPIKCPICAMGANQDYDALEPAIKAWVNYTQDDFSYRMFEGTHFYIKEKEEEVLSQIKKYFDKVN